MKLAAGLASLLATSACVASTDGPVDPTDPAGPIDPDPADDPDPDPTPEPDQPTLAPSYDLVTAVDVEASVALPQPVYDAVDLLRGLRDAPGETLFDLAEAAGVPAVDTIRDALPSSLESKLYGWIDGYVQQVTTGDGPVALVIDGIVDASEHVLGRCELTSTLVLDGGLATHHLDTIGFDALGVTASYDLADVPSVIVEDAAPYAVEDARLAIGAHAFGLPYGELALRAIEDALVATRGTDLRGTLGALIDCPALAATVASKCVLGVCVGHEAQLEAVCDGALDYAVGELRDRFDEARFDALALHAGTATMLDVDDDGRAELLRGGVWTAELDAGLGPRPAPATFETR